MSRFDRTWRFAAVFILAVLALAAAPRAAHMLSGGSAVSTVACVAGAEDVAGGWRAKHFWLCAATAITIGATIGVVPPLGAAVAVALVPVLISACI